MDGNTEGRRLCRKRRPFSFGSLLGAGDLLEKRFDAAFAAYASICVLIVLFTP
ncbi:MULTISPECIES: hypothetical protein [unclassified Mesorhizobium]|uniref:hypothetical protein n=1 Tax=unclassified Mesorhizobium TaxID=325217 RepID=UPI0016779A16|nr:MULTISPECIES: hypothetical protein [unclassified Mesorhizobium]